MTGSVRSTGLLWQVLCVTTWTLACKGTGAQGSAASSISPSTRVDADVTVAPPTNYTDVVCLPPVPPRWGSFSMVKAAGLSEGTALVFWCQEGFQLVGSERMRCVVQGGAPRWSNHPPVCELIPRPEKRGLRLAVLMSVVSSAIIIVMSAAFIICCLQEYKREEKVEQREETNRTTKPQISQRSECWIKRKEEDWDTAPSPKIYHLSQDLVTPLPVESLLHVGHLSGYENHGYESQESQLNAPIPGLYCAESQVYSHMVPQTAPTPTAPSALGYVHPSAPTLTDSPPTQPVPPPYPKTSHPTSTTSLP
ncbi:hypothetical protein P4O66_014184 [Electrophorus voltai]|uniref:Sushi domain-containing protein n=1 Tax=Electrophorus voltai TaxID=2609070 RepID=A0AAD8Z2G8_9TELE|nr:hypothetical protein P4O66_014184 [Electrophorus voltai]